MNNINDMLAQGRERVVGQLMNLTGGLDGLNHITEDERKEIASRLRALATMVETAPEHVAGIVCFVAEKVHSDTGTETTGLHNTITIMITGATPFIAAAYLQMEEHGRSALDEVMPALLSHALSVMLAGGMEEDEAQSPVQPS